MCDSLRWLTYGFNSVELMDIYGVSYMKDVKIQPVFKERTLKEVKKMTECVDLIRGAFIYRTL